MVFLEIPSSSFSNAANWRGLISSHGISRPFSRSFGTLPLPGPSLGSRNAGGVGSVSVTMHAKPWSGRRLHFVGVGGAGMSGLALVAHALGAVVTGSDRAESTYMVPLREAGIDPAIGHDAANVPPEAEVVVSTAIPDDNPEVRAATGPVLHRSDLLAEVSRLDRKS